MQATVLNFHLGSHAALLKHVRLIVIAHDSSTCCAGPLGSTQILSLIAVQDTRVPYPLLSDEKGGLRKAMGVKAFLGVLPGRVTYVISKHGVLLHKFDDGPLGTSKHVQEALTALQQQ